jgi:hypothetical protein
MALSGISRGDLIHEFEEFNAPTAELVSNHGFTGCNLERDEQAEVPCRL